MSLSTYTHLFDPGQAHDHSTLILLHGTGDNEESFMRLGHAISPTAAKISIRGNVSENGMNRFFRRMGEGVYDMDDLAKRTEDLGAFISDALVQYGRDTSLTFGVGYSNGANILANLLFEKPSVLGRVALLHPLIPFEPKFKESTDGASVLITSGAYDPISPAHVTDKLEMAIEDQGIGLQRYRHSGGHEIRMEEIDAVKAWMENNMAFV